jgi:N-acetyl-anhydromuramyl-L-alanine amidase AmpD
MVCGQAVQTDARVVRWDAPNGLNGYLETCFFESSRSLPFNPAPGCETPRRYSERNFLDGRSNERNARSRGRTMRLLRRHVDQIVIHYDAAGSSRRCFQVLHDERGLSSHFLLDTDGTIYQTLDVRERARHAGDVNDRGIGIEIANLGAYEHPAELALRRERLALLEPAAFTGAPSPPAPVVGDIQGRHLHQYPFTEAQYDALISLVAALCRTFPNIKRTVPRDRSGRVVTDFLPPKRRERFRGILGHYHVSPSKIDPGPAFNWNRLERALHRRD